MIIFPQASSTKAFTLLEIVIAIAIVALMAGMGTMAVYSLDNERELKQPAAKIQEFAKRARNQAIFEQRPFQLEISPHSVVLSSIVGGTADQSVAGQKPAGQVARYDWGNEATATIRRWNTQDFAEPGRNIWIFERSGLCEPLTVRVESESGFVEMTFRALDGSVEQSTEEIH